MLILPAKSRSSLHAALWHFGLPQAVSNAGLQRLFALREAPRVPGQVGVGSRLLFEGHFLELLSGPVADSACLPSSPISFTNVHVCVRRYHLATAQRKVCWSGIWTELVGLVPSGLSVRAYCNTDAQSDKQAAQKLSPACLKGKWHEYGAVICGYIASLLSSAWAGARGFSLRQALLNNLLAFYFIALNVMHAVKIHGLQEWDKRFLPLSTVRCCLHL